MFQKIFCVWVFILSLIFIFSFKTNKKSRIKAGTYLPTMPINTNNIVTKEGVLLGRYLFYDPVLSANNNIACASCHKQSYAFADNKRCSIGINNTPLNRNTKPIFNVAWAPSLFWDGRSKNVEELIFHPITNNIEMNNEFNIIIDKLHKSKFYLQKFAAAFTNKKIDSTNITLAIAQFVRTLISSNSKYEQALQYKAKLTNDEKEGAEIFNDQARADCVQCHSIDDNTLGTRFQIVNNGLENDAILAINTDKGRANITNNILDRGKFMTPSLRNIAVTAPYMHDGRFKTLEEVLDFYSEHIQANKNIDPRMQHVSEGGSHLTKDEKNKIIAFLKTMTDYSFIKNKEFGNPFLKK
jgi:cytochrome c peroxidase